MKKTQFIELLKNISHTIVSFLAIMIFVLGSTALYTGLSFGSDSQKESVNAQMNQLNYRDLQLIFPYGASEEDLSTLMNLDGISSVEGYNYTYSTFKLDDRTYQTKVIEETSSIDLPYDIKGSLPAAKGEIAIESTFAEKKGIQIGDTITFVSDDDGTSKSLYKILNYDIDNGSAEDLETEKDPDGMAYLTTNEFTVTALVECAAYLNTDSSALGVNENNMQTIDCVALVAGDSMDRDAFLGYRNVLIRSDSLRSYSYFSDEYTKKLNELKEKIRGTTSAISLGKSAQIMDKVAAINQSLKEKYDNGAQQIANAQENLDALSEYIDLLREVQQMGITNFNDVIAEYDNAVDQLAASRRALEDSRIKIDQFKTDTANIESADCYYIFSYGTANLQGILAGTEAIDNMKLSLVGMFMAICLLVCYSVISRIVNDQVTAIGTKKALGLSRKEVALSYILYTGSAAVIGALLGLAIGTYILQGVIARTSMRTYVLDKILPVFDVKTVLILISAEIGAVILITVLTALPVLKRNAIQLLQGPEPPKGKELFFEKWSLWRKISLFNKAIIKNTLHEKRRVIGTLIGISGCCALIVAALTLNNNMLGGLDTQFEDFYHFDTIVMFNGDSKELEQALLDKGIQTTSVTYSRILCDYPSGKRLVASVFTPDNEEAFEKVITIEPYKSDAEPYTGTWIGNSLKNEYDDVNAIDTQTFSGDSSTLTLNGYFVCHLNAPQILMDKDTYTSYFGKAPQSNALLLNRGETDLSSIEAVLSTYGAFCSIEDFKGNQQSAYDIFSSLSVTMVSVFLAFSVVLAIMMLLTILSMYVQEKKKELIVLMINGYSLKHARKYIYKDTIFLTIIGIAIGCVYGHYMGILFIGSIESDAFYLIHSVDPLAIIVGIVGCGIATFVMCLIALKQIDRFELTDINKF